MNKYLLLIILLVTGLTGARAQYDSQLSQYFMALGYYNPAYAGVTGDLNMLALSRLQYVGIDGAPTSFFINADMPLKIGKTNHGIGMVVFSGMGFDSNAGLYYHRKNLYAGLGVTHLNKTEIILDEYSSMYLASTYNLIAGYNIQFRNPLYELQPSVFLKTDMQSFQADITARLFYNKMFNGGFSWRVNESLILLLGAKIGSFQVGYAYDFPISTIPILKATSGSHELVVSYKLKLKKSKSGKNRHKSVRIL